MHSFLDSVYSWDAWESSLANKPDRARLFHFYADYMGGKLAAKSPSRFSSFGKFSALAMLPFIQRSSDLIESIYEKNKEDIFAIIDTTRAYKLGLDILADDLAFTYDTLFSHHKPKTIFKKYERPYSNPTADIMAIITGKKIKTGIDHKIMHDKYSYYVWIYTFWYRRYLENNMDICLNILKEIQKKYPVRKKYAWRNKWYNITKKNKENYLKSLTPTEQEKYVKIMKNISLFSTNSL